MTKNYAQSGKENSKRDGSSRRGRLGGNQKQSKSAGNEIKDGVPESHCTGIYRGSENFVNGGEASLGKILSQLRELQRSHLAYVEAHEERLQNRLKAAKEHHTTVMNQMNELEQEILCLLGETVP
jgi:hypothetical protein